MEVCGLFVGSTVCLLSTCAFPYKDMYRLTKFKYIVSRRQTTTFLELSSTHACTGVAVAVMSTSLLSDIKLAAA